MLFMLVQSLLKRVSESAPFDFVGDVKEEHVRWIQEVDGGDGIVGDGYKASDDNDNAAAVPNFMKGLEDMYGDVKETHAFVAMMHKRAKRHKEAVEAYRRGLLRFADDGLLLRLSCVDMATWYLDVEMVTDGYLQLSEVIDVCQRAHELQRDDDEIAGICAKLMQRFSENNARHDDDDDDDKSHDLSDVDDALREEL